MRYVLLEIVEFEDHFRFYKTLVPHDREEQPSVPCGTVGKVFMYWPQSLPEADGRAVLLDYLKMEVERKLRAAMELKWKLQTIV